MHRQCMLFDPSVTPIHQPDPCFQISTGCAVHRLGSPPAPPSDSHPLVTAQTFPPSARGLGSEKGRRADSWPTFPVMNHGNLAAPLPRVPGNLGSSLPKRSVLDSPTPFRARCDAWDRVASFHTHSHFERISKDGFERRLRPADAARAVPTFGPRELAPVTGDFAAREILQSKPKQRPTRLSLSCLGPEAHWSHIYPRDWPRTAAQCILEPIVSMGTGPD